MRGCRLDNTRQDGIGTAAILAAHVHELVGRASPTSPQIEVEMLYGIRPDVLRHFKDAGYRTRVYLTYGTEWYLYLCHRLAEYPPNIYQALADCVDPSRTSQLAGLLYPSAKKSLA